MLGKEKDFAEYQAREKLMVVCRRYINIFHQLHVVDVPFADLNRDFLSMPEDAVRLLPELSGGEKLYQHIQYLKSGATPIDKINPDLLPFGSDVFEDKSKYERYTGQKLDAPPAQSVGARKAAPSTKAAPSAAVTERPSGSMPRDLAADSAAVVFGMLRGYRNTPAELEKFKSSEEVKDFGPEWKSKIDDLISASGEKDRDALKKTFGTLVVFDYALGIWQECASIVKNPKGVVIADVRAKLPEYKKYLGMFGEGGRAMYAKVAALANADGGGE